MVSMIWSGVVSFGSTFRFVNFSGFQFSGGGPGGCCACVCVLSVASARIVSVSASRAMAFGMRGIIRWRVVISGVEAEQCGACAGEEEIRAVAVLGECGEVATLPFGDE